MTIVCVCVPVFCERRREELVEGINDTELFPLSDIFFNVIFKYYLLIIISLLAKPIARDRISCCWWGGVGEVAALCGCGSLDM